MKKLICTIICTCIIIVNTNAQVGIGTKTPNPSSILDLTSTNKGLLLPRLTVQQRDSITNPTPGLMIFNLSSNCVNFYITGGWYNPCQFGFDITPPIVTSIAPTSDTVGQQIAIKGSYFTPGTYVSIGGQGAGYTVINPDSIVAIIPVGVSFGTNQVSVGDSGGVANSNITIVPVGPAPTIISISPSIVSVGQTVTITITGTNLANASATLNGENLTFGGNNYTNTNTSISALVYIDSGFQGSAPVSVTTKGGVATGSITVVN
jgi:hypothetical protein